MAFFTASTSASCSPEEATADDRVHMIENSDKPKKLKENKHIYRTLSSPPTTSSSRSSRSTVCLSRSVQQGITDSFLRSRSLRSISSPSRIGNRRYSSFKYPRNVRNLSGSFDFKFNKRKEPKLISGRNSSEINSHDDLLSEPFSQVAESPRIFPLSHSYSHRVGRSVSSPENLLPNYNRRASQGFTLHSQQRSPGRFSHAPSIETHSELIVNGRNTASFLPSPSISYAGDFQNVSSEIVVQNLGSSSNTGISGSIESALYSSGNSLREELDGDSFTYFGTDSSTFYNRYQPISNLYNSPLRAREFGHRVGFRNQGIMHEDRATFSQLALAHLASKDHGSLHFSSPPPSYDKLCNPEALPTYQEVVEKESGRLKRLQDTSRLVFTLPNGPNYRALHNDSFVQDREHNSGENMFTSMADLSDSEGGYTTILDAIPVHPARETSETVPIRFISRLSPSRFCRISHCSSLCLKSLCNRSLVRKEINLRWPFILRVVEQETCPGLLLIECSSNLTMTQLPDVPRSADSLRSQNFFSTWRETLNPAAEGSSTEMSSSVHTGENSSNNPSSQTTAHASTDTDELQPMNSHLVFYLCGKCVAYDSFDAESVKTHMEYDCPGSANVWSSISELYLVLRASCVALVVVLFLIFISKER